MDLDIDCPHTPERTCEAAELAAEAIRYCNHATGHHREQGLRYPADVDRVLRSVAALASRLPQLVRQAGEWLGAEHAQGRVAVEYGDHAGDPAGGVEAAVAALADAAAMAEGLRADLASAAEITAAMSSTADDDDAR